MENDGDEKEGQGQDRGRTEGDLDHVIDAHDHVLDHVTAIEDDRKVVSELFSHFNDWGILYLTMAKLILVPHSAVMLPFTLPLSFLVSLHVCTR